MVYGWTMHREMQSLVTAGLTPYQALAAATRNPAEYFGAAREWGTIEAGKRADLVLLDANPLEDIRNTTHIAGVAIGGRWLPKSELERMIRAASERINDR
jgi:imidazolonepropionase-like amidohydrolase